MSTMMTSRITINSEIQRIARVPNIRVLKENTTTAPRPVPANPTTTTVNLNPFSRKK